MGRETITTCAVMANDGIISCTLHERCPITFIWTFVTLLPCESFVRFVLVTVLFCICYCSCEQPNIVFVLADDLGWNDVGYSPGSGIETPWIDSLAAQSLRIPWSYTQSVCTPSRAAIMTGSYPFRYGLQRGVIKTDVPEYLNPEIVVLPRILQQAGYTTHLVGKWHLGYCNERLTPLQRGFSTFHGFLSGHETYYTHQDTIRNALFHDYWDNELTDTSQNYSMHDFTRHSLNAIQGNRPFFLFLSSQAPHAPLELPPEIQTESVLSKRERYRYMVRELDKSIGKIVTALKEAQIWNNTIFIFTSDNGGQPVHGGNNFPLRGTKHTLWEGGTRIRTFIHHNTLTPGKYEGLFHAVDWLPTILAMAGGTEPAGIDGINQWIALQNPNLPHPRKAFIYDLDIIEKKGVKRINAAVRLRENTASGLSDFKLVLGFPGARNGWYHPGKDRMRQTHVKFEKGALFDMTTEDGRFERKQVHADVEDVKSRMMQLLKDEMDKGYVTPRQLESSPAASMMKDQAGRSIIGPGWC